MTGSGVDTGAPNGRGPGRDLYAFLRDAELEHYYTAMMHSLKVTGLSQLKYVEDEDLAGVGMTKPEMRRLRKRFQRECPQSAVGRLCRRLAAARGLQRTPPRRPAVDGDGSGYEDEAASALAAARGSGGGGGGGSDVAIPSEQLQLGRLIGEGDFARVYEAVWKPTGDRGRRLQVAAKIVAKALLTKGDGGDGSDGGGADGEGGGADGVAAFMRAAAELTGVDHRSVARLFGICAVGDDHLALVTELAPLRSLLECVREPALRSSFHPAALCDLAQQVAEGMSYLENRRIVHRDLAARNVLVFSQGRVKIGDTGVSRALGLGSRHYRANLSPSLKLPAAWCAPECLKRVEAFTSASDVWSYGVLLWEAFTYGFQPWAGLTGQQILATLDESQMSRLSRPDACPAEHYALMLRCWSHRPTDRPTFAEVAADLPKIIPERVTARRDSGGGRGGRESGGEFLRFTAGETIVVLDKAPPEAEATGSSGGSGGGVGGTLWRGVRVNGGGSGLFWADATRPQQLPPPTAMSGSADGETSRVTCANTLDSAGTVRRVRCSPEMISGPRSVRHTCHVGVDGTVFGNDDAFLARLAKSSAGEPLTARRTTAAQQVVAAAAIAATAAACKAEDDDDFRFDLGGSLVDEVLKSWSMGSGGASEGRVGGRGECGGGSGGGAAVWVDSGDDGNLRSRSLSSSLSSDAEQACAAYANDSMQRGPDDSTPVSVASSVSSLMEGDPVVSADRQPAADRRRCSSVLAIPPIGGGLHRPPHPPLRLHHQRHPDRQNQRQNLQHQLQHQHQHQHQHQQQHQHPILRSLRTMEAFRVTPGGRPPPKPVRPIMQDPGSPWGSAFNLHAQEKASPEGGDSSRRPSNGSYDAMSDRQNGCGLEQNESPYDQIEEVVNL